mmetsp:Transcript_36646/g.72062  ORF Transcript_36646/g.72062 Transcript_36646/m.72062 type:complete len:263 (+) Transcript_36646:703-1491(+)
MHKNAQPSRRFADLLQPLVRPHHAVHRVFNTHTHSLCVVNLKFRVRILFHLLRREEGGLALSLQGKDSGTGVEGDSSTLMHEHVGSLGKNDLGVDHSRLLLVHMHGNGHLVRHGARGKPQGGLLATHFRNLPLEGKGGLIVSKHIVAQRGFVHGCPHALRGLGDGVGTEVRNQLSPSGVGGEGVGRRLLSAVSGLSTHQNGRERYSCVCGVTVGISLRHSCLAQTCPKKKANQNKRVAGRRSGIGVACWYEQRDSTSLGVLW